MNIKDPVLGIAISSLLLGGCASITNQAGSWKESLSASEEVTDYEDRLGLGVYAAIGIGASRLEPDTSELANWDPNDRVEPAGQVTIGADLTKHFSIEGHSADLGSAGLSPSGRINYHINGVSALLYAGGDRHRYRRQGLTAYGRIGAGALENTAVGNVPFIQDNSTHMLFGAGVEYMTPFGVGLRAEGISFDKDVRYAQIGLMYRTGRKQNIRRPKLAEAPRVIPPPPPPPVVAAAAPPPPPPVYTPPAPLPEPNRCDGLSGVLEGVGFHTDSAGLTSESTLILDEVAYTLSTCGGIEVEVEAHTDSVGSESYNQSLSEKRAQSVVDYLTTRGLDRNRLKASAYGESSPIDTNATADGRERNRRVEVYVR